MTRTVRVKLHKYHPAERCRQTVTIMLRLVVLEWFWTKSILHYNHLFSILLNCDCFVDLAVPAPGEWTECGGREWRMFQENMTWSNAERICQSYGGHLAYLEDTQSRTTCAKKVLQTCFGDGPQIAVAYVGLTNIFDLTAYRWVRDNSMRNITATASRLCSTFNVGELLGLDNCSVEYPFICERPLRRYLSCLSTLLVILTEGTWL